MIYGYCRCSTQTQKADRQIQNITSAYPTAVIVCDYYTGSVLSRPNWIKLYKRLKTGDVLVFDDVSRMSRNANDGFALYEELYNKGIELHFLKEPHIDTTVYRKHTLESIPMTNTQFDPIIAEINRHYFNLIRDQVKLAFQQAENEVTLLRQRTVEGIAIARLNGKQIGQKKGVTYKTKKSTSAKEVIRKHAKVFGGSLSDRECWKLAGISRNTFYKYKAELIEEEDSHAVW
jgi:DNA invertase Pin-like site-specific DNA recombinase